MEKTCRSGKIFVTGKFYEEVEYDVCSNEVHATFDGKGGITYSTLYNENGGYFKDVRFDVLINGEKLDPFCDKRVKLVGRTLTMLVKKGATQIEVAQFLAPNESAVFWEIKTNRPGDYEFLFDLGSSRNGFFYSTDVDNRFVAGNDSIYLRTKRNARLVLTYESMSCCTKLLSGFSAYRKQVEDEIKSVKIPPSAKTERDKTLYVSSIFCALENYKEFGLFKGFCASSYTYAPVLTFFRDSYWTVLPMYKDYPHLIRNQILTLALGIDGSGNCTSSVAFDFLERFRSNHYDSPCFFVLMVYDYINRTGDRSILSEEANGKTVYDYCLLVIDKLMEFEDRTGLIVKLGRYNNRDWADQINRTGYVTYVELLYARALFCLSRIVGTRDQALAGKYRELAERTKNAIDRLLWDDGKGYYVNYRDGDFVEDNLSVDTILAVLFRIADKDKTERILDNVEKLLETRNNRIRRMGDFGVMCVYPHYRGADRSFSRSQQPYCFHNGAAWPYWSALVAYAYIMNGRDPTYALTSSFIWNLKAGNYTPNACYSPIFSAKMPLHARSSDAAWVYDWQSGDFFDENPSSWQI